MSSEVQFSSWGGETLSVIVIILGKSLARPAQEENGKEQHLHCIHSVMEFVGCCLGSVASGSM